MREWNRVKSGRMENICLSRLPQWASDGEETAPHHSMRSDVSLSTEIEILSWHGVQVDSIKKVSYNF